MIAACFQHRFLLRTPLAAMLIVLLIGLACASDEERVTEFMERGQAYVEEGDDEEAIIEFKNVLQRDPNHAAAHEALSLAYLRTRKAREAYWEMSETVRLDPENIEARLRYGTLSAAIGDHELALEQANAILGLDSDRAAALTLRAQALEAQEDFEQADADFQAALEAEPDGAAYHFLYAGFLERQGRRDEAIERLRALVDREPSFLAVSTLARLIAAQDGSDAEAEALMRRSIEVALVAPDEPRKNAPTEEGTTSLQHNVLRESAVPNAYTMLASFLYERGRFEESVAALEEGVDKAEKKTELIYQMARLHRANGDVEKADQMIYRAAEAAPEDPGPQLVLSSYLGQQGDLAGALEAARAAVAIEPDNRAAQLREAELLVDLGYRDDEKERIREGREIVDSVLEEEPSNPEAHFVRAKIELAEGDAKAAEQSLNTVLEARPDWPQARFVLGSTLAVTGEHSRARVELARAIELDPTLAQARKLLTNIHSQLGEHEFAVEQGRAYLAQAPGDHATRIVVAQSLIRVGRTEEAYEQVSKIPEDQRDAQAYFALGRLETAFGRVDKGRDYLLRANEEAPGNAAILRTLFAIDRQTDRLEASRKRVTEAAEAFPEDSEIAELQGEIAAAENDAEAAMASLRRAVDLDPRNVSAQLTLADLARRRGDLPGMIEVLERAAEAMPGSADLQYRLGLVYEQAERPRDSIAAYERAIELNADLAIAKNNLAYLLASTPGGDLDRALELAQQAKELRPDDPNTADTLGWVLLQRGVPSAAIGYLEEAAGRFPDGAYEVQGVVRNHLAEAYEKNQEPAKARAASQAVLESFEKLSEVARQRGVDVEEPDWAQQARARLQRLGSAG